nr:reverse transcriptase domain-containing protein [Tanacetum cinerariifolium]
MISVSMAVDYVASNEGQDDIQLMRFADYFRRTYSSVPASQFPQVKLLKESPIAKVADSSVEDLVPIPSESEDISGSDSECDLPSCDDFSPINVLEGKSVTFSNPLFDSNDDFTSSDDESLSDEDVLEENFKIYSNPFFEFDDEYISSDINPLFDEVYDSNLDEPNLLVIPLSNVNKDECFDPGGDVDEIELLLYHDPSTLKMSIASILKGINKQSTEALRVIFLWSLVSILADLANQQGVTKESKKGVQTTSSKSQTLFTDGSSCVVGSGAGLILTILEGTEFTYTLRFQFTTSNNKAEYEALIAGLWITAQIGVHNVYVSVDYKLVENQVLGTYVAKEENMVKYLEKTKSLISDFTNFSISQVPRSKNKKADAQSKIASTSFAHLSKQVLVEVLKEKSIQEEEVVTVEDGPTWMTPIMEYLKDGTLPDDKKKARKLPIKARQYELLEGVLYKRSFRKPGLRTTLHGGQCHVIRVLLANYALRRTRCDRTCNACQVHRPVPRNPQQPLTPITTPWPFYKWGIDIAGPFPEGPRKVKFLIVAMDYFTKWIEAKAVATITGNQVKKFVWDNIVCHFGLLGEIVLDNGKQFSDNPFKDWCENLNITQRFALMKHP